MADIDATTRKRELSGEWKLELNSEYFSISISFDDVVFAIELFGELDIDGVPTLEAAIARAEETSAQTILVDLSALQFIDGAGVCGLLAASRRSNGASGRLHFLRGTGPVERTIELCGLDERLPFID